MWTSGRNLKRLGAAATIMVAVPLLAVGVAVAVKPKGSYFFSAPSSPHHPSVSFTTAQNGKKLVSFQAAMALKCTAKVCGGFGGIRSFTRSSVKVSSTGKFKVSGPILSAANKKLGTQTVTGKFVSPTTAKGQVRTHADLGTYQGTTESYTAKGIPATSPAFRGHAAKTTTLKYFNKLTGVQVTSASGTPLSSGATPAAGGHILATVDAYPGNHVHHAKTWTASASLHCTITRVVSRTNIPARCESVVAIGGSTLISISTQNFGSTVPGEVYPITAGTGKYLHATGTVKTKNVGKTNNQDAVITIN